MLKFLEYILSEDWVPQGRNSEPLFQVRLRTFYVERIVVCNVLSDGVVVTRDFNLGKK